MCQTNGTRVTFAWLWENGLRLFIVGIAVLAPPLGWIYNVSAGNRDRLIRLEALQDLKGASLVDLGNRIDALTSTLDTKISGLRADVRDDIRMMLGHKP